MGPETEEDDGIPFEKKMKVLKTQLLEQFEKSRKLQKVIQDNFNTL